MKTLLVLAQHPEFINAVQAAVGSGEFRVLHRTNWEEAEPLLLHNLAHACLLDADMTGVQTLWLIEKMRRALPRLPIIVCSSTTPWELEEEAYLKGVTQVVHKPIRARMFTALLSRFLSETPAGEPTVAPSIPAFDTARFAQAETSSPVTAGSSATLQALRDYSSILTHSLNAEGMLKQFLLFLRETLGINRAAIFLRPADAAFGGGVPATDSRRLQPASALGLPSGLLEHFELSFDAGIGGLVFRLARILRRQSDETRSDVEAQKEFELLGVQIAVPILDRETVIGVAVFDRRVTGESLTNPELELIFQLLEHVGLGIRNIWQHDQMAANNEMMANVLRELSSACVVIRRDLAILHVNKTAKKILHARSGEFEFTDLPHLIGNKVYQVLKTGSALEPFRYEPEGSERGEIYRVSIAPFQRQGTGLPNAALLVLEDLTQGEMLKKLELEASNLRLVKDMAERLAPEVGNALVPLSTHQQLLADRYKDPEFRASLDVAMADSVKRIDRICNQMRFLAWDSTIHKDSFPLGALVQEAFQDAQKHQPVKAAKLKTEDLGKTLALTGDRPALKQALKELFINALQANPTDPQVTVRVLGAGTASTGARQSGELILEILDNGPGFAPEVAAKAVSPFFTTRTVATGLGLTVARKIVEAHRGRMEILPAKGEGGVVRLVFPLPALATAAAH